MFSAHKILYVKSGENWTTPASPFRAWRGDEDLELLDVQDTFCLSSDDDRPVQGNKYELCTVTLPDWLPPDVWVAECVGWKYAWGHGADPRWPEAWQRAVKDVGGGAERAAMVALLGAVCRSEFRAKMREQIITWIETPSDQRKYRSPLSPRQWDAVINRHAALDAKRTDENLYRGGIGGLRRCTEHPSCVENIDAGVNCAYGRPKNGSLPVPGVTPAEALDKIKRSKAAARPTF